MKTKHFLLIKNITIFKKNIYRILFIIHFHKCNLRICSETWKLITRIHHSSHIAHYNNIAIFSRTTMKNYLAKKTPRIEPYPNEFLSKDNHLTLNSRRRFMRMILQFRTEEKSLSEPFTHLLKYVYYFILKFVMYIVLWLHLTEPVINRVHCSFDLIHSRVKFAVQREAFRS